MLRSGYLEIWPDLELGSNVMSPVWRRVVKEACRQKCGSENMDVRPKPLANQPKGRKLGGTVDYVLAGIYKQ